jgi:hypothetical protein
MSRPDYAVLITAVALGAIIGAFEFPRNTGYAVGIAGLTVIFIARILWEKRAQPGAVTRSGG